MIVKERQARENERKKREQETMMNNERVKAEVREREKIMKQIRTS